MKRIFIFLGCVAVLMSVTVLQISADSPESGTINSAALNYFTGVVNKLPANSDYVIFRSGDYSGTLIYGNNFELNGSTISCSEECTKMIYDSRGSGSSGYYSPTITTTFQDNFILETSITSILYSSVGDWASVGDANKDNITYILYSVVFLILLFVFFKFYRNRRHYINL